MSLMRCAVAEMSWDTWQKMAVICSYMAVWSRNCVELRWKRLISSSSCLFPICSMYGIFIYLHEWLKCMVNVGTANIPYMEHLGFVN